MVHSDDWKICKRNQRDLHPLVWRRYQIRCHRRDSDPQETILEVSIHTRHHQPHAHACYESSGNRSNALIHIQVKILAHINARKRRLQRRLGQRGKLLGSVDQLVPSDYPVSLHQA